MPMSSEYIAQLAQQNYQANAMRLQSAFGRADQYAGTAMNTAAGTGGSLVSGAMGMLGMDPMSLGISAGMAAFKGTSLGMTGSMGVGLAAAMPAAIGMGAAGYMGHQMMQGANQQQHLNQTLASSFNFQNQSGRRGFSRGDTSQIGSAMREMSHEVGPGGELTSMKELTDLAGKMGQMGMGKGVRDAQEFNQKFREMIKTVKSIATEMNTSMSQAAEFMQASKQSGMFQKSDQIRFAAQVQGVASSSGLATSEVSAMGNIGSQISRAYGGLGKQGAMGGMRAIGQIGGALQSNVISEEDIYNATGQSGAEGRQTLASNMMSQTGSFLKSGKGRYFMASMAGKDGHINEADALKYMSGNIGVGDTKGMAGKNLGEVGRANFIRNEGRLRGAVMERFGALAPSMALMGWASGKGVDINNMDDRSMLFAQRQLGMGRDEMDVAVKMAQDLPRLMREQTQQGDAAKAGQRLGMDQKGRGLEGAKRRIEHAKEKFNAGLQQAGADMYSDLTKEIDSFLDNWTGTAVPALTQGLSGIWKDSLRAGKGGADKYQAIFGGGGKLNSGALGKGGVMGQDQKESHMGWEAFNGGERSSLNLVGRGLDFLTGVGTTSERMRGAGYGKQIDAIGKLPGGARQTALTSMIAEANEVQERLSGEVRSVGMTGQLKSKMLAEYAQGVAKVGIADRGAEVEKILKREAEGGDKGAAENLVHYRNIKSPADKAAFIAGMEKTMGVDGSSSMKGMADKLGPLSSAAATRREGESTGDYEQRLGDKIRGGGALEERDSMWGSVIKTAAASAIAAGSVTAGVAAIPAALVGGLYAALTYGGTTEGKDTKTSRAVGAAFRTESNMVMTHGVMKGKQEEIDKANKLIAAGSQEGATLDEKANAAVARSSLMMKAVSDASDAAGGFDKLTPQQQAGLLAQNKKLGGDAKSFDELASGVRAHASAIDKQQEANAAAIKKETIDTSTAAGKRMEAMGTMERNETTGKYELTEATKKTLKKGASMAAEMLQLEIINEGMAGNTGAVLEKSKQKHDMLSSMSVADLAEHVKGGNDADAAVMLSDAKRFKSLSRSKGGAANGIAAYMGLGGGESRTEKRDLQTAMGKGADSYIKEYVKQTGLSGEAASTLQNSKEFKDAINAASKGGDPNKIASALTGLKENNKPLQEELSKRAEAKKDPSQKIVDQLVILNGNMKTSTVAAEVAKALQPVSEAMTTAASKMGGKP